MLKSVTGQEKVPPPLFRGLRQVLFNLTFPRHPAQQEQQTIRPAAAAAAPDFTCDGSALNGLLEAAELE
jgi:hypothetical protein